MNFSADIEITMTRNIAHVYSTRACGIIQIATAKSCGERVSLFCLIGMTQYVCVQYNICTSANITCVVDP